jgi:hypothetical protein
MFFSGVPTTRHEICNTSQRTGVFHFKMGSMTWERDGSTIEIRTQGELPDGRPALDEIVAKDASVHLEQADGARLNVAVDTVAGERERLRIVFGKWLAVSLFSTRGLILNLTGFAVVIAMDEGGLQ